MTTTQLDVLAELSTELSTDWTTTPGDVWRPSPFHVDGLHGHAETIIRRAIARLARDHSPQGITIQGQKGAGKTHLLGWVRQQVQNVNGYFFLVTLHDGVSFWDSVSHCVVDGLTRSVPGSENQLRTFLRRLAAAVGMPEQIQDAVAGELSVPPSALNIFVDAFRAQWPDLGADCHDTLRALVLRASKHPEAVDVGLAYLQGHGETETGERRRWGIRHPGGKNPQWMIDELLRLLALTGTTVIAVDQIDALIARFSTGTTDNPYADTQDDRQLNLIAAGLTDLREQAQRTLCIVSCLPPTWELIRLAQPTAADRFRHVLKLASIPSVEVAEELVAKRFAPVFQALQFAPPYSTWPVRRETFTDAPDYTPRRLLQLIDDHIVACLNQGKVAELVSLDGTIEIGVPSVVPTESDFEALDERFRNLCARADVSAALDPATEDEHMPMLLTAGLRSWIDEQGVAGKAFSFDVPPPGRNSLHGVLRRTLNEELEDEQHWAFRGIASTNARAALTRLRDAYGLSGSRPSGGGSRKLVILRRSDWAAGEKTQEALAQLEAAGGITVRFDPEDLAVFDALRQLREQEHSKLTAWLQSRRPASRTKLLTEALGDAGASSGAKDGGAGSGEATDWTQDGESSTTSLPSDAGTGDIELSPLPAAAAPISVGAAIDGGQEIRLPIEALRRHVAIFAGSGSGKTVLIRRLIEECALRGVSSIVLDPGNDLARLGDPWPREDLPASWTDADEAQAAEYLANTDVVIWTPRHPHGRPLAFQPLPDFSAIQGDEFELEQAVEAAVATLAPRAKVAGEAAKAVHGRAVLREAMMYFASKGYSGLRSYVELLRDLPEDVSEMPDAQKIAADMAKTLTAEMLLDPLFGGAGTPVDPGVLLTPAGGKRARVSVISFVGLSSQQQQQSFVNQLQLGLFTWLKKNPAVDRPLGGLLVMDEAQMLAPSNKVTTCSKSTIMLVTQARKYGLGLVFGTQGPKDLDNHIPSNAATQFFGRLGAGAPVDAAREIAKSKGSTATDFADLKAGTFYVSAEAEGFTKVSTPLCLSHHARSALTPEEVTARARGRA